MATVSTPVRQPFGVLNESKLRSLQSIKNRQNGLVPSSAPNLKRRAPSPELSDSENIDPNLFDSAIKRKRASFDDDVSLAKQPRFTTHVVPSNTATYTPPASTTYTTTPRLDTLSRPSSTVTPLSAPAAAGRSPTRLTNKHRIEKSQSRRRFVQPNLGPSSSSPSLSITSLLRGTLAHKKRSSATRTKINSQPHILEEAKPKSWFFDIFEESEETQDYRMCEWTMTQSSAALDISDDESKLFSFSASTKDDRGKENVDPNEMFVTSAPVTRAAAAAALVRAEETKDDKEVGEPRTPLGDLNAADYYGEGLNATSVVLVHDDEVPAEDDAAQEDSVATELADENTPASVAEAYITEASVPVQQEDEAQMPAEDIPEWAQRATPVQTSQDVAPSLMPIYEASTDAASIEIWESESAKDENENENGEENTQSNTIVVGEGEIISLSAFALQEL
ncbi:hypothetical protein H2198_009620 [Neophaeococcomyces mojaviensis]|uniref:Uncharacterized protein n=1 Tax=Neophaeococcomyces mojaviensis TaxID=3383035 RepID=A0ACC2ZU15_9EURO|nr:hypothetical protein H2198_009620 [Knufia sp. JES_112]